MESPTFETWPTFHLEFITNISIEVKILYTIFAVVVFPIGYLLICGIVRYEIEEGDPQKRSIFNQLHSALFSAMGIYFIIGSTISVLRCWLGPLGSMVGLVFGFTRTFYLNLVVFMIISMLLIKIIGIIHPKLLDRLNDNFWAFLISLLNITFSLAVPIAVWFTYPEAKYPPIYCFFSGECDMGKAKKYR